MKAKDLLNSVATLSGIEQTNESVRDFFDKIAGYDIDVPEPIAEAFGKNVINRSMAMRDQQIVKEISSARESEHRRTMQAMLPNYGFEADELLGIFEDGGKQHDINTIYANVLTALATKEQAKSKMTESERMLELKALTKSQVEEAKRQALKIESDYLGLQKEMSRKEDLFKISRGFDRLGLQMTADIDRFAGTLALEHLQKNGYYLEDGDTGIEVWQKMEDGGVRKAAKSDGGVLVFSEFLNDIAKRLGTTPKSSVPNYPAPPESTQTNPQSNLPPNVKQLYPTGPTALDAAVAK